jgi:hypothetical protein
MLGDLFRSSRLCESVSLADCLDFDRALLDRGPIRGVDRPARIAPRVKFGAAAVDLIDFSE